VSTRAQIVLAEIAALLELQGESPLLTSEQIATVTAELDDTGECTLFDQLRESTPEGLFEMMRVPGLGTARIRRIHEGLHIDTLQELEAAARDGRLVTLPRFGAAAAEQVLRGIAALKESGAQLLLPHGRAEAERLLATVRQHAGVVRAEVAGGVRRHSETVRDLDIVAGCAGAPETIAAHLARAHGVRDSVGSGTRRVSIRYTDGTRLNLTCVPEAEFVVAWWRATGSDAHVRDVVARAAMRRFTLGDSTLTDASGTNVPLADEPALYAALGLPWMPPELREGLGETRAAMSGTLPSLITGNDLRGVLHCHSQYSDGGATIAELAADARRRGWSYLGVSDHSQSSFYAGGLTTELLARQHDEIDALNATLIDFRVLKGVEADILPCGRVDYPVEVLDRFDYVIASVHSRFGMDEAQMTHRVLKALDDPHVTILGHPTGRLLLTREPYAIDMNAVLEKAAHSGVAVELNADPHRLDLDWRLCRTAREHGTLIEIGPDAHSVEGLDNIALGIGMARKGWLGAGDVLNTRTAVDVIGFAKARKSSAALPALAAR
jgi:DNA polymerase (family 10)